MRDFDDSQDGERRGSRGGDRRGGSRGGDRGGFRGGGFQYGERQMYDAVCAKCKKECKVPFQPREDREVFCKECYVPKERKRF